MEPWSWVAGRAAALDHGREGDLCDNSAELAECGADTVGGAADAGGEAFGGDDEGRGVGAC